MKTFRQKTIEDSFNTIIVSLIFVTIHVFWNNSAPVWYYIFSGDEFTNIGKNIANTILLILFSTFIFSIVLSISVLISKFVITIVNFVGSVYTYYVFHFGIQMSDELMVSMLFYSESNDVISSFDWTIFIYVPLIFVPSQILILTVFKKYGFSKKINFSISAAIQLLFRKISNVLISISLLPVFLGGLYLTTDITISAYKIKTVAEQTMPLYLLARKKNIKYLAAAKFSNVTLKDYSDKGFYYANNSSSDPLIVVLVIGESLRSDRLSINGYTKKTNNYMGAIPNLFSFKNVLSCSTTTAVSLPCMLTDELRDGWIKKFSTGSHIPKYSVAKVFTDLGFETKWLSAANKDFGIYSNEDFHGSNEVMLSNELRKKYMSKLNDFGDLLLVEALDSEVEKNTLFVLGTMGSHRDYFARYPKRMAKFKPDIGQSLEAINNAYDNTVVYFDKFIFKITEKLKNHNAIVLYISDHGESLGENEVFLHGAKFETAPNEQKLVPMVAWMSDKYIQNNSQKLRNIENWLALNNSGEVQVTHDFVFHSLLDCSGISSSKNGINNELSICSDIE